MVKHKVITLSKTDGAKSISEVLGSDWPFTFIKFSGSTAYQLGDSALDVDTNPGIFVSLIPELHFECKDDIANNLYIQATSNPSSELTIFAY